MKSLLRAFLPQWVINNFYHLPKAILANIFYGFPTRGLKVIGVTGTDGKTTTVNMINQILLAAGKKVSMVSTINSPGLHVTSPDPFLVQKFARDVARSGDEYLILEVTSHALDQFRFWGVNFTVGVITNITHEHLDYHKTFENYLSTKLKLIQGAKTGVINVNLRDKTDIITFGLERGDFNQKDIKLKLKIPGEYNIENGLAAMAVAFVLGVDKIVTRKAIEDFEGIAGRMEEVKNSRGIKIIIDFAHTPNGLEQALKTLRSHKGSGKLISLIGCEGFRDVGKREMMGEIAQKLSDIIIVTSVDPRGQMDLINRQIAEGAEKAGAIKGVNFFIIEDRREAISFAINKLARRGDRIGIFGKGHERSMNLDGKHETPWSDREAVEGAVNGQQV